MLLNINLKVFCEIFLMEFSVYCYKLIWKKISDCLVLSLFIQ